MQASLYTERGPAKYASEVSSLVAYRMVGASAICVYAALLFFTRSADQGDTMLYVGNVVHHVRGTRDVFWEFGHPLWRPLAFAIVSILHPDSASTPQLVLQRTVIATFTSMAIAGGVLAILAFLSWLQRFDIPWWISLLAAITLMLTSAFLGFAHTGSAYIPALAFVLVGSREIATDDRSHETAVIIQASFAFALAVLFWFPIVLGVPAAAASTLILRGNTLPRRRIAIAVCLGSGVLTLLSYAEVANLAGVRTLVDFQQWVSAAGHGISGIGGLARTVVGFARSFVDTGRLGLIMKRHLIHDPYNGATWSDVVKAGLFRIVLLYLALTTLVYRLLAYAEGRRALVLLAMTALPVLAFAYKWQGGDPERYLALYPALFMGIAFALASLPKRVGVAAAIFSVMCIAATNIHASSRTNAARDCARDSARLMSIPRNDGKVAIVVTPHELDEILTFRVRCPDAALAESANAPQVHGLVMANNAHSTQWRRSFVKRAKRARLDGDHIWIAKRAFADAPLAEWDWAEGDDPRLHWRDFPAFFEQFDVGQPIGGADGFVELLPTPSNDEKLQRLSDISSTETRDK